MGVYLCEHMRGIYEIRTANQGIVYLILTGVYLVLEIYCILESIKICKTQKNIRKNYVLIVAHTCIHILFIRDVIFMPGGVLICYSKWIYPLISTLLYIIKHVIILVMLFQILCILLDSYTIPARKRYLKKVIIAMIAIDVSLHIIFFMIAYITGDENAKVARDIYSITDAAVIMAIFNYFMIRFKNFLKRMQKFVPDAGDYKATIILRISINGCFIARIIYKIIAVINSLTGELVFKESVWYAIYMGVYYFLNEMFPCIMIFHTMKRGGKEHYMKLDVMFKLNKKKPTK
jgi:hypothetical protein